jgi:hypothetical protein
MYSGAIQRILLRIATILLLHSKGSSSGVLREFPLKWPRFPEELPKNSRRKEGLIWNQNGRNMEDSF